MSIADHISRINNAKISMIEAIQSKMNGEDLSSVLKIDELAPYITSACQIQYQLGLADRPSSSSSTPLGTIEAYDMSLNGTVLSPLGPVPLTAIASNGATCTFSGSLPSGLSMTSAGVISGTPIEYDYNHEYQITVSAEGCSPTILIVTAFIDYGTISVNGSPSITGTAGSSISSVDLTQYVRASNNQPCTFSGSLPTGLSLSSGGTISGTPTNAVNRTYQITVYANGCTQSTIDVAISIEEQVSSSSSSSGGGSSSGGNNDCVLKGTKIALADGTKKNVEDITYSDVLLVWDFDNGKFASAKPAWIHHGGNIKHCWKNEFSNGTTLFTTGP